MTMKFSQILDFNKDLTRYYKKYKSLTEDLQEFRNVITIDPLGNTKHFNTIMQTDNVQILKARLFCKDLKGSSLRIVYAYFDKENRIEFIELYFKGVKTDYDRERVQEFMKSNER